MMEVALVSFIIGSTLQVITAMDHRSAQILPRPMAVAGFYFLCLSFALAANSPPYSSPQKDCSCEASAN
jgi:hypothetical protein